MPAGAGAGGGAQPRPLPDAEALAALRLAPAVLLCRGTFFYQVVAEPAAVARGYEGIVRYDPTGSVVMHSSLSLIHLRHGG